MQLANVSTNPFALLMAPDAVFAAVEKSDCLRTLTSRVCKPLDDREAKQATPQLNSLGEGASRCLG